MNKQTFEKWNKVLGRKMDKGTYERLNDLDDRREDRRPVDIIFRAQWGDGVLNQIFAHSVK